MVTLYEKQWVLFRLPPKVGLTIMVWVFVPLSIGLLLGSLTAFICTRHFVNTAARADGTVNRLLEESTKDGILYRPVFEFRDARQQRHEMHSAFRSRPPAHQVGDKVTVLYAIADPDNAVVDGFWDLWFNSLLLAFVGSGFLITSVVLLIARSRSTWSQ
jgi:hypothetical protein